MSHATVVVRTRASGKTYNVIGNTVTRLVSETETGGGWSLFELEVPLGTGAPPHVHDDYDEVLYVTEGEIEVTVGEHTMAARPGQVISIPRGTLHAFCNRNAEPARFLAWTTPGGAEALFDAFDREASELPPNMDRVLAIAARHRTRVLV